MLTLQGPRDAVQLDWIDCYDGFGVALFPMNVALPLIQQNNGGACA